MYLGGSYTFEYIGGGTDCTRRWKPTFICDDTVDHQMGIVKETSYASCEYETTIYTKHACDTVNIHCSMSNATNESGLSGGWIFIILLICAMFTYFVAGYIYMALTVNKEGGFGDVTNNIPNKQLWINCIPLIIAGCTITKEYLASLINKDGGTDKGDAFTKDGP